MPTKKDRIYSKNEIQEKASQIRSLFFPSSNPSTGIENILKSKKGAIHTNRNTYDETLIINNDKSFIINLPGNTSPLRDTFTIAHELGHYFLHTNLDEEGAITFNRKGSSREETEANWFAAELLMPKNEFLETAKALNLDLRRIAAHFGVSGAAARVRMSVLKLI